MPNERNATAPVPSEAEFLKQLNDGRDIFLYSHGVGFHRAVPVRISVYKLLSNMGYHVIAHDYRGEQFTAIVGINVIFLITSFGVCFFRIWRLTRLSTPRSRRCG